MTHKIRRAVILTAGMLGGMVFVPVAASAATANTTILTVIGSTISVSSSGTVNINITPVTGGSQSSAADTVSVSTNNTTGYTLKLADSDATTDLVSGSNTITAHTGTQTTPTALANNSWGYHVDSVGGFDADGAAEDNVTTSTIKYAGVPANASPNTLKTTSSTASGDTTTVYYGVKADTTKPNGIYSDTVTYTATTNP